METIKAKADKHNFQGGSLLVVEDKSDHWMLIQYGLQKRLPALNLEWAPTAPEALAYIQARVEQDGELPRLVLLDLYLPRREDGFDLLRALKTAAPLIRRIPVVILSSSDQQEDVKEAYQLGSSSYFVKPTEPGQWEAYLKAIVEYWGRTATLPDMKPA